MQSMGTLKRVVVVFFSLFYIFVVMPVVCNAMPPIDYSEGAAKKLDKATYKVHQPVPKPGATNKDIARLIIDYWKQVYAAAGYDLEKSIVKIHRDLLKDPEYISKISYSSASSVLVSTKAITDELVRMFTTLDLNPNKFLAKPTASVINEAIANNKKEEEAVQDDEYRNKLIEAASSSTSSQDEQSNCLQYGVNVELKGNLKRVVFPGRPNYESLKGGDEPEPCYVLYMENGRCVQGNPKDEINSESEKSLRLMQLMISDYNKYRPLLGKEVTVKGQLIHSSTGHHHTKVLVDVTGMAEASSDITTTKDANVETAEHDYCSNVEISIKNARTQIEAYYAANHIYPNEVKWDYGAKPEDGVVVEQVNHDEGAQRYTLKAIHPKCNQVMYIVDSYTKIFKKPK